MVTMSRLIFVPFCKPTITSVLRCNWVCYIKYNGDDKSGLNINSKRDRLIKQNNNIYGGGQEGDLLVLRLR